MKNKMYAKIEDSPEQSRILRQLKEMFATTPTWRLRDACRANNWHLDSCVNELMNFTSESQERKQHNLNSNRIENTSFSKNEERIGSLIKKGFRIMILMRGPPGVGKSFLSRSIVNNFVDLENNSYNVGDFIFSSDDYFYSHKKEYKYNSMFITNAHEFNQQRVKDKSKAGLSPIIVDNTNMQLWEMLPYVKCAVQNNYLIEIMEPKTPWCNSYSSLAQKNNHGVTKHRIQQIMQKYEKGSVASLMKMLKNIKYTKTLPQMRLLPPLNSESVNLQVVQTDVNSIPKEELSEKEQTEVVNSISTTDSKEQRFKLKKNKSISHSHDNCSTSSTRDVYSLLEEKTAYAWKTFESESADFWGIKSSNVKDEPLSDSHKNLCNEKSILDLLREDSSNETCEFQTLKQNETEEKKCLDSWERHSINCPNENTAFVILRQIYPNKRISGLWDLFVKCNGDVDWAVDILLKENELEELRDDGDIIYQSEEEEIFDCLCNNTSRKTLSSQFKSNNDVNIEKKEFEQNNSSVLHPVNAKPQRQRAHCSRYNQLTNPALLEIKENIENCFVLGDDLYSQHLLKIRNIRSGIKDVTDVTVSSSNDMAESNENVDNEFIKKEDVENIKNEDDEIEDDNESNNLCEDMLEISLGEQLIQQLVETFRNESSLEEKISSNLPNDLQVFMPRSLAKQLYMLWMESAFNHLEEERLKMVREDEDFARLLKNPKYSEIEQSPSNLQEILDMEYAWKMYNLDKEEKQQRDIDMEDFQVPTDLASHLTQIKLCETFPDIPSETLLDILTTNGNDYNTTVAVLQSTMKIEDVSVSEDRILDCDGRKILLNQEVQNEIEQRERGITNNWDEYEQKPTLSPDESKRLALREFEESRNLAAHHCQLKAECYQKAKEAIQSGNGGAAIYYSQIANLHIKKIDMYNHRAANCIIDVHKNTQNNPDLLDLHYLYLIEALGCLDLFLDRHITGLRIASRNYKHVFIITGRGKHSAGGVSTIKNKVKARLKERCLRWSEVNPGLLKVKIFSGSRHSKNI